MNEPVREQATHTRAARRRSSRSRVRSAVAVALTRWAIAVTAIGAVALYGDAEFAGARDGAPDIAPAPAPSPRGEAADYTVGGFDPIAAWETEPRRIEVRPTPNPLRLEAAERGSEPPSAEDVDMASAAVDAVAANPAEAVDAAAEAGAPLGAMGLATFSAEPPVPAPERPADQRPPLEEAEVIAVAADRSEPLMGDGPSEALPRDPLSGEVGYMVVRVDTREIIAARNPDEAFIPASVAKVPTALYALETLGPDYRFRTRLIATGEIEEGVLKGDLYLVGGGDPTLDTGDLADLVATLQAAGVERIDGAFFYDERALPTMPEIEGGQPVYASYNPGVSGLSLNFNRVLIKWTRLDGGGYDVEMRAHAAGRWVPALGHIAGLLGDGDRALFRHDAYSGPAAGQSVEVWNVAPGSLGRRGQRWLPVRDPAYYAALTMHTVAAEDGLILPAPTPGVAPRLGEKGARVVAEHESRPISAMVRGMLKFSTNLTAEALGLTATGVRQLLDAGFGAAEIDPSRSLAGSGDEMASWVNSEFGLVGDGAGDPSVFYNHSGLTAASRITPRAMVQVLVNAVSDQESFDVFYELMPPRTGGGVRNTANVRAKTGTIYYGRALAGYIECKNSGALYAFAYFNSDPIERAAFDLSIDVHAPAAPRSASVWLNRAVSVERALMTRWTQRLCG